MHLIIDSDPSYWQDSLKKTCFQNGLPNKNSWRVNEGNCGLDIPCPMNLTVPPGVKGFKIHLGVKVQPEHHFWLVPRSSISKTPLRMSNSIGLIDVSFRGELIFVVDNISTRTFDVLKGTRLCQIVSMTGSNIMFDFGSVNKTNRGSGGFGSTT